MKLEDALKQNPYDKTRGSKGAYIRYLRYAMNTYIAMLKTRGGAELENYGKNINFVSTINTNSNLKFKADFDLGDRITCKETKWGIQIDARITEVTETYQKGEETIEATFGDSLPTLVDQIRKVR